MLLDTAPQVSSRVAPFELDAREHLVLAPNTATYHTSIPRGALVHHTRESAAAALWLLDRDDPGDCALAERVLERVLSLQVADPTDRHHGIWGWFAEEPPVKMAPADFNWADFIGLTLLKILHYHGGRLDPALRSRIEAAATHAAWAIYRRNVGPGYTNIAAKGAVVCLVVGERLGQPLLVDYGRRRLSAVRALAERDGAFAEYNSPVYSLVLMGVLEDLLHLARNEAARRDARWMLDLCWRLVADHFHPGTAQWAGAQARAYADWTPPSARLWMSKRIGRELPGRPVKENAGSHPAWQDFARPLPCPEALRARFEQLPTDPHEHVQVWTRHPDGSPREVGTTWFSADATLGSINRETGWDQRRFLVGYWRTERESAVRLRARVLHNGRNFDSAQVRQAQRGPRVLSAFFFVADGGDWHPTLDVPKDGAFASTDLRVRYEVEGAGVDLRRLGESVFEFSAGGWRAVLHGGSIRFDGAASGRWECGGEGERRWVDAIFFQSAAAKRFCLAETSDTGVFAAIELLPLGAPLDAITLREALGENERACAWPWGGQPAGALSVAYPLKTRRRAELG